MIDCLAPHASETKIRDRWPIVLFLRGKTPLLYQPEDTSQEGSRRKDQTLPAKSPLSYLEIEDWKGPRRPFPFTEVITVMDWGQTLCGERAWWDTSTCHSTDMTCMHRPRKATALQGSTLPRVTVTADPPGQRKGDTQSLTTCIFPAQWQSWELSIASRRHLHKDAEISNVHLTASNGRALRGVKALFRAAKQTPLMKAYTIITGLISSIQLWKAISRVKQVAHTRHPSKKRNL